MPDLRLVIFDVDGTLVDSQGDIVASMQGAFAAENLSPPPREIILSIVGLSLPHAIAELAPDQSPSAVARMVDAYKDSYAALRIKGGAGSSPLYPGASEALEQLGREDWTVLAIATGKSRRGLTALLESHDLGRHFVTAQVADDHPSKPHPSMILTCLAETGVAPDRAVMVGDTRFDMDMAQAAGIRSIGVSWGYHPADTLQADRVISRFEQLPEAIDTVIGGAS